jgi:hypothetical protein
MKKQNHRQIQVRGKAKKSKTHNQRPEIKKFQDELKQASKRKKKTKIAVRRLEGIRDGDESEDKEKATNQEVKQQLMQEIKKRLDAEQQVFDMKEGMEFLRKEITVVKEKHLELKGQDLNPLIGVIRDLQVEASEQNLHLKETMVSENERCLVGQQKRSKSSEKSQTFACSGIWGRGPGKRSSKTHLCESNFITMAAGSRQMTLSGAKRIAQNSDSGLPIHFTI